MVQALIKACDCWEARRGGPGKPRSFWASTKAGFARGTENYRGVSGMLGEDFICTHVHNMEWHGTLNDSKTEAPCKSKVTRTSKLGSVLEPSRSDAKPLDNISNSKWIEGASPKPYEFSAILETTGKIHFHCFRIICQLSNTCPAVWKLAWPLEFEFFSLSWLLIVAHSAFPSVGCVL